MNPSTSTGENAGAPSAVFGGPDKCCKVERKAAAATTPINRAKCVKRKNHHIRPSKLQMEKRRRFRINHSFTVLREIILASSSNEDIRSSKLEKVHILNAAIKQLQTHVNFKSHGYEKYKQGYLDCIKEIKKFIESPGLHLGPLWKERKTGISNSNKSKNVPKINGEAPSYNSSNNTDDTIVANAAAVNHIVANSGYSLFSNPANKYKLLEYLNVPLQEIDQKLERNSALQNYYRVNESLEVHNNGVHCSRMTTTNSRKMSTETSVDTLKSSLSTYNVESSPRWFPSIQDDSSPLLINMDFPTTNQIRTVVNPGISSVIIDQYAAAAAAASVYTQSGGHIISSPFINQRSAANFLPFHPSVLQLVHSGDHTMIHNAAITSGADIQSAWRPW